MREWKGAPWITNYIREGDVYILLAVEFYCICLSTGCRMIGFGIFNDHPSEL